MGRHREARRDDTRTRSDPNTVANTDSDHVSHQRNPGVCPAHFDDTADFHAEADFDPGESASYTDGHSNAHQDAAGNEEADKNTD